MVHRIRPWKPAILLQDALTRNLEIPMLPQDLILTSDSSNSLLGSDHGRIERCEASYRHGCCSLPCRSARIPSLWFSTSNTLFHILSRMCPMILLQTRLNEINSSPSPLASGNWQTPQRSANRRENDNHGEPEEAGTSRNPTPGRLISQDTGWVWQLFLQHSSDFPEESATKDLELPKQRR
ncbi:hypothetical protein BKA80DRAFT_271409 [Phyllosticta citrichinensis]